MLSDSILLAISFLRVVCLETLTHMSSCCACTSSYAVGLPRLSRVFTSTGRHSMVVNSANSSQRAQVSVVLRSVRSLSAWSLMSRPPLALLVVLNCLMSPRCVCWSLESFFCQLSRLAWALAMVCLLPFLYWLSIPSTKLLILVVGADLGLIAPVAVERLWAAGPLPASHVRFSNGFP